MALAAASAGLTAGKEWLQRRRIAEGHISVIPEVRNDEPTARHHRHLVTRTGCRQTS